MSEASVTYIPAGFSHTTTEVLASQLQLIQTYLLARCNSNRRAYWSSLIVTDVPGGRKQQQQTCLLVKSNVKNMGTATGLLVL